MAQRGRVDGDDALLVLGGDGPSRVLGSQVELAQGETLTRTFRFELPNDRIDQMVIEPTAACPTSAGGWMASGSSPPRPR